MNENTNLPLGGLPLVKLPLGGLPLGEGNGRPKQFPSGFGWVASVWRDMQQRAAAGESARAEDYLSGATSASDAVDVIYAEFVLRTKTGELPTPQEFLRRFPQYSDALRRQFAVDGALSNLELKLQDTHWGVSGDDDTQIPAPQRIGKFTIVGRLSSGGQAEVFRATHPELHQEVVIKLATAGPQAETHRKQILAEGRILADLDHPCLGRVYDVGFHDGQPFLVTRYVRGRTLNELAKQESPPLREMVRILASVARGLGAAHRRGVVHLDIKPENIVVDETRQPCLIDFGLALICDAFHQTRFDSGKLRGTMLFMAPEQAMGDADQIGPCSDIFGLGAVLYYLCVGEPPYSTDNCGKLLEEVRRGAWRRDTLAKRKPPRKLRQILNIAMHGDPQQRFRSCDEFADALERFAGSISSAIVARRLTIAGMSVSALAAVAWGWKKGWLHNDPANIGRHVAAPVEPPTLSVEVYHSGRYIDLSERAPLQTGDRLRITASIPAGHHATLFLLNSEGRLRKLSHLPPSSLPSKLRFPQPAETAVPLIGPSGTEVVFLCLRRDNPMSASALRRVCGQGVAFPHLPPLTVLTADLNGVYVKQSGRDFGSPEKLGNPEEVAILRLEEIRRSCVGKLEFLQALAFHHGD